MNEVRIRIVQESQATGEVAELYERLRQGFGMPVVPDVFKLASLRPDFLRILTDGWEAMFLRGVLPRPVKEMIATLVSRTNSCQFCTRAHGLLLRSVNGSSDAVTAAKSGNVDDLPVDERYRPLLRLSVKVTEHAYRVTDEDIEELRTSGLTDEEILEGVFVASLFNAINRLADTFGLYDLMQLREVKAEGEGRRSNMVSGPSLQQQLDQKVQEIRQAASAIGEERALSRPGDTEWSAKEILSHLAGPEEASPTDLLERCLNEDTPTLDIQQGVSAFTPDRQRMPVSKLMSKVESTYGQMGQFLGGLSEEELNRKAHVPLLKETPIGEYTTLGTVAGAIINFHLNDHVQQLQRLAS